PLDLVSEVSDGKARAPVKRASSGQIRALEVLELDEKATAEEVKTRYKARIKKFHPDANNGDRSYEEKLNKVIQAYNYLKASGFC
ncbi:MAG: DnaJ domain-containing protein, partial [Pseudomonadota bacterium]|nr:DnaJ domain-containing protein [Pseudomonadota bacterium]